MAAPEPQQPDPLLLLARPSAAKRRRPFLPALILLLLLAGGAGFVVWYFWPRGEYPAVALAVFDQVARPDERVTITARLEPVVPFQGDAHLGGAAVFVQDSASQQFHQVAANVQGFAGLELAFPAGAEVIDLVGRHPGTPGKRHAAHATGRVFVWPADVALLIVDADGTLADADEEALWTANNVDLRPVAAAGATLQAAAQKRRIVYLSAGADWPTRYNKLRAWLLGRTLAPGEAFPAGPVLAPAAVPEDARERFVADALADLRRRFPGAAAGVTKDPRLARLLLEAGCETFVLGEGAEAVNGVTPVKSWAEFRKRFGS